MTDEDTNDTSLLTGTALLDRLLLEREGAKLVYAQGDGRKALTMMITSLTKSCLDDPLLQNATNHFKNKEGMC